MPPSRSPYARIREMWDWWHDLPGGKWVFAKLLGLAVPYTATIKPRVVELRPGYARVEMEDRRRVRNHLNSIHAIALMNLGEVTSGLAAAMTFPDNVRAIPVRLSIDFVKKARGTLTAECTAPAFDTSVEREHDLETVIKDRSGDVVARAMARWRVGPLPAA